MRAFTDLFTALGATTSTSEKVELLEGYFRGTDARDGAWALALLTGRRPKGAPSTRALRSLCLERAGIPDWLLGECHAAVGEFAETVALLLPGADAPPDAPSLADVVETYVVPLAGAPDADRRGLLGEALSRFGGDELYAYLKILRGGMRVGAQRRLVARALAGVAGVDRAVMEHRLAGGVETTPEAFERLLAPDDPEERRHRPYPFFLAHPLDGDAGSLGDRGDWIAEWKWDGVRAQLLRRDEGVAIWSRGEEVITHQFPEIVSGAAPLPDGTALDGEVLLWSGSGPAPFASLQRRLNRTHAPPDQLGLFETERPVFMAFDLLEEGGVDLRERPQSERRERLERLVSSSRAEGVRLSPEIDAPTWAGLAAARAEARERGVEGVVLKRRDSPYLAGRVKPEGGGGWVKWKVEPRTVDAVLVYAYPGSGRRATLYTDYAFAVWDGARRELVQFARAYSGLTREEIERLDAWIRRNTTRRHGPARAVEPAKVFEIGFEGIAPSDRHKAGVAVRFPRILRERTDKAPEDADDLGALRAMLPGGAPS